MPTMTLEQFADYLDAAARKLENDVPDAVRQTTFAVRDRARAYSSGPFSLKLLRRMDHPYARRHGSPQLPAAVINQQTGIFWSSWEVAVSDEAVGSVFNTAPHARYLYDPDSSEHPDGGTTRMFGRPLPETVADELEPEFEQRVFGAVAEAFRF